MAYENAKQKAIKYIGISKKTVYEVNQKLSGLGYNQDIIDEVISYLLNIGYLDDIDYTNSYIKQSIRMHKYSILEITQKLLQKGIKKDIIEEKIQSFKESGYDRELFQRLLETKCKNMEPLKRKQYMYRRGIREYEEVQNEN